MTEPRVSVLMPTHNRPVWLAEALRSVLEGEFTDVEVVVSNNGLPEHTRDLARSVRDPRVRWFEHDRTSGMLSNFLAALAKARGRYVAVLHDDDRWAPNFLARLVPPLERDDVVISFADLTFVTADGLVDHAATGWHSRRWGRARLGRGPHRPFFGLVARQTVPLPASVFRRDALPLSAVPLEIGTFYDVWVTYQLARTGLAAHYVPDRLMYYRTHGGSATRSMDVTDHLSSISCRRRMLADARMRPYSALVHRGLARDHLSAGAALLRSGDRRAARAHLGTAVDLSPSVKAVAGLAASVLVPTRVLSHL